MKFSRTILAALVTLTWSVPLFAVITVRIRPNNRYQATPTTTYPGDGGSTDSSTSGTYSGGGTAFLGWGSSYNYGFASLPISDYVFPSGDVVAPVYPPNSTGGLAPPKNVSFQVAPAALAMVADAPHGEWDASGNFNYDPMQKSAETAILGRRVAQDSPNADVSRGRSGYGTALAPASAFSNFGNVPVDRGNFRFDEMSMRTNAGGLNQTDFAKGEARIRTAMLDMLKEPAPTRITVPPPSPKIPRATLEEIDDLVERVMLRAGKAEDDYIHDGLYKHLKTSLPSFAQNERLIRSYLFQQHSITEQGGMDPTVLNWYTREFRRALVNNDVERAKSLMGQLAQEGDVYRNRFAPVVAHNLTKRAQQLFLDTRRFGGYDNDLPTLNRIADERIAAVKSAIAENKLGLAAYLVNRWNHYLWINAKPYLNDTRKWEGDPAYEEIRKYMENRFGKKTTI